MTGGGGEANARETPRPLFETRWLVGSNLGYFYDVPRDGQGFLLVQNAGENGTEPLALITNWPATLRGEFGWRDQLELKYG